MGRYVVEVGSPAGPEVASGVLATWSEALAVVRDYARRYPGWLVTAGNLELTDHDTNGLTEDERDELDDAVDAARRVA